MERKMAAVPDRACASERRSIGQEHAMQDVELPWSGDVSQVINPWTAFFKVVGNRFSFLTVNVVRSRKPTVEKEVLAQVGSYGRQLGRVQDALAVLVARFPEEGLSKEQQQALADFRDLFNGIADVKEKHTDKPVLRFKNHTTSELTTG
jgi:hypothetical protein